MKRNSDKNSDFFSKLDEIFKDFGFLSSKKTKKVENSD